MPSTSVRQSKALHDSAVLRDYVHRHGGLVSLIALGFAITTCACLFTLFALVSALGGDGNVTVGLGLGLWLIFNAWAIRTLNLFLHNRAKMERPQVRFK